MEIPALEVPAVTPVVFLAGLIVRQWGGYRGVACWVWRVGECSFYQ